MAAYIDDNSLEQTLDFWGNKKLYDAYLGEYCSHFLGQKLLKWKRCLGWPIITMKDETTPLSCAPFGLILVLEKREEGFSGNVEQF